MTSMCFAGFRFLSGPNTSSQIQVPTSYIDTLPRASLQDPLWCTPPRRASTAAPRHHYLHHTYPHSAPPSQAVAADPNSPHRNGHGSPYSPGHSPYASQQLRPSTPKHGHSQGGFQPQENPHTGSQWGSCIATTSGSQKTVGSSTWGQAWEGLEGFSPPRKQLLDQAAAAAAEKGGGGYARRGKLPRSKSVPAAAAWVQGLGHPAGEVTRTMPVNPAVYGTYHHLEDVYGVGGTMRSSMGGAAGVNRGSLAGHGGAERAEPGNCYGSTGRPKSPAVKVFMEAAAALSSEVDGDSAGAQMMEARLRYAEEKIMAQVRLRAWRTEGTQKNRTEFSEKV